MNEMDELEQEEAERQQRARLNKRFLAFAKLLEEASEWSKNKIEVDIPEDALSFTGCPQKQVVKIRPTKECLVALSEFPFFVLDVNEIEIFHFERMFYGMKNFDLAVIKKDFTTCLRINSIPMEYAEEIKSYINDIGVIFIESMAPLKWDLILNQIKEDFNEWLEQGAWLQFVEVSKSKLYNQSSQLIICFRWFLGRGRCRRRRVRGWGRSCMWIRWGRVWWERERRLLWSKRRRKQRC